MSADQTRSDVEADTLEQLLHPTIAFGGRSRQLELRVPSLDEILAAMEERAAPGEARVERWLRTQVLVLVETVDGIDLDYDDVDPFVKDTDAVAGFVRSRNALFEVTRESGRLFAQCPHCRRYEMSLSVFALVAGLGQAPWPIVHPNGVVLNMPSLATPWPKGKRPEGMATASRIRFEVPSAQLGLESVLTGGMLKELGPTDGDQEVAAWKRWAPHGVDQPSERSYWRWEVPGFRALLRLALSVESPDLNDGEVTPATLEPMSASDFYFLDNLYYLTHTVDVPASTALLQACAECGRHFLPVR